jgi:uncharacterized protein (TIGR02001 family)
MIRLFLLNNFYVLGDVLMKALKTAIFAATMMSGATAMAAEVSGNVAIGSDYFFRGFDQSLGEALSGGFDVGFENGLYAGVWGSSVDDFTSTGGLELDYYAGYGGSFSDAVSYDIGYIMYGYPNDTQWDFEEVYGSISVSDFTVGFATSSDWYGSSGDYDYFYGDYGMALNEDFSLGFHYGATRADAGDYEDYSVSLSTEAVGLGFDLSWISTSESGTAYYADNEFVLTISKSL